MMIGYRLQANQIGEVFHHCDTSTIWSLTFEKSQFTYELFDLFLTGDWSCLRRLILSGTGIDGRMLCMMARHKWPSLEYLDLRKNWALFCGTYDEAICSRFVKWTFDEFLSCRLSKLRSLCMDRNVLLETVLHKNLRVLIAYWKIMLPQLQDEAKERLDKLKRTAKPFTNTEMQKYISSKLQDFIRALDCKHRYWTSLVQHKALSDRVICILLLASHHELDVDITRRLVADVKNRRTTIEVNACLVAFQAIKI